MLFPRKNNFYFGIVLILPTFQILQSISNLADLHEMLSEMMRNVIMKDSFVSLFTYY